MKSNRRKAFFPSVLFALCVSAQSTAYTATPETTILTPEPSHYSEKVNAKLGRGIENFFVGWMEFPHQIKKTNKEGGALQASTLGVGKGLVFTLARMGVGVYEIFTFPFAQDPIMDSMEEWEQ